MTSVHTSFQVCLNCKFEDSVKLHLRTLRLIPHSKPDYRTAKNDLLISKGLREREIMNFALEQYFATMFNAKKVPLNSLIFRNDIPLQLLNHGKKDLDIFM